MMDILAIAVTSFVVTISGAVMPGPLLTIAITESARRGVRVGPLLIVGHGLVELPLFVALVLGVGSLLRNPLVGGVIGVVGGVVLLWMAYGMLKGAWRRELSLSAVSGSASMKVGPVVTGGLVSISNPYWILWWATAGMSCIAQASLLGSLGLAAFFGGHILSDLCWYSLVTLLVASGRQLLSDGMYRGILMVCGLFLVCLSVYFVFFGLGLWLA